ncbi:MAG TPA: hypothetical protein VFK13_05410 [Gemmatimonadaceae bacterium]|nr:hypothetical protein [Gemmatimonadaceae bacterium]
MSTVHAARIHWSTEQLQQGLPAGNQTIDPVWLEAARPRIDEGWSLVCEFEQPPVQQGNPSLAHVHFALNDAPQDWLRPGTWLCMFERATQQYARRDPGLTIATCHLSRR